MALSIPSSSLLYRPLRAGYLPGEVITARVLAVDGRPLQELSFRITASPGGGFAGQVYQAAPVGEWPAGYPDVVAIKVLRPRSGWKIAFRDALFWITFQTSFAPRLREPAVRSGLLWQTVLRAAAEDELHSAACVARPVGYFWDPGLGSFVEIHEWVPSRAIRYEADDLLLVRWFKKTIQPAHTEMERKKVFMDRLAGLCRKLGASGLARQYDWYTFISQANVLTRSDGSGAEHCAVDCRPGLAFPFFLPLSPAHLRICLQGLWQGLLAHFDESDLSRLEAYLAERPDLASHLAGVINLLHADDAAYRAGLPDLWQRAGQLLFDPRRRQAVRAAAVEDWLRIGQADAQSAEAMRHNALAFGGACLLQAIPLCGALLVRLAAHSDYRRHILEILRSRPYRISWLYANQARDLAEWAAHGRIPPDRTARLERSIPAYLAEKITCAWLPPGLHRLLVDPAARRHFWDRKLLHRLRLLTRHEARVAWLENIIQFELERGVLEEERAAALRDQASQPQMRSFLRDLGFSAGLDVFSRLVYLILGLYAISTGDLLPLGLAALGPVPPSGPLRVLYILALLAGDLLNLLRRRRVNRAGRLILARIGALLLAPWRGIGNLFPVMEMSAYYPRLSLLLADYSIEQAIDSIPVLGGRGKLLEYWAFQTCYNIPMSFKRLVLALLPQKLDAVHQHTHLDDENPNKNDCDAPIDRIQKRR